MDITGASEASRQGVAASSAFIHPDPPSRAGYESCVHCGFCLPVCPTYQVTGLEEQSPRGRVFVIRAAAEGRIPLLDEALTGPVDTCLDCRACETVCPSHVPIGTLVEQARGQLHAETARKPRLRRQGRLQRVLFRQLFPHPRRWDTVARMAHRYQNGRLRRSGVALRFVPAPLRDFEAAMPDVAGYTVRDRAPEVTPARGERRLRVGLFTGCIQDVLFTPVNAAALQVLARNGCEVVVLKSQVCCGALHRDTGERDRAKELARRNIDAFLSQGLDRIVSTAGGCGAALSEYPSLLSDDPAYKEKAQRFGALIADVTKVLSEVGIEAPRTPVAQTVTYHESCHLANVLATRSEPRAILRSIPGLTLVEMADPSRCCGSAGIYNLEHPEMGDRLLADKMATVPEGVDVIAAGNPGCALQLAVGVRRTGRKVRVAHPVELLFEAYRRDDEEAAKEAAADA